MEARAPCPICHRVETTALRRMGFGEKPHLPAVVTLHACPYCDFAFTWPRDAEGYRAHYASVVNDLTQRHGQYQNSRQIEILVDLIATNPVRSVLDFGCGGGGLIHALAARFPEVDFRGFDVNADFPSGLPNLKFETALPDRRHDLVILSHVVEHIPDLTEVSGLFDLVAPGGLIYVEMPDPFRYEALDQPQFGYYLDRLHINHFSQKAFLKLAPGHFDVVWGGTYPMPYSLGETYPAQFVALRARLRPTSVQNAIEAYVASEVSRWATQRETLKGRRFFVYGFGDNFHRSLSPGGPLEGLEDQIIAIIDRNAPALAVHNPTGFSFVEPTDRLRIDGNLIVCTVSQFTDMSAFFADAYPRSPILSV